MLYKIYTLPKFLIAVLFIGLGVIFILINDPPHTFCDTQIEHFERVQKGILYKNTSDFHKEKSILERKRQACQKENAPGACYGYFHYLKRLLKDLKLLSEECSALIYQSGVVKKAFSQALSLMTALAWREGILTGIVSKYNWFSRPDLFLFCELKRNYIRNYGRENYKKLEKQILNLLPFDKKYSLALIHKKTILSESCASYR